MAKEEEIQRILKWLRENPPNPMLHKINESQEGMRYVMAYLHEKGTSVTPGEISKDCEMTTARVAVVLKKLEAKGYILRETDQEDKRRSVIFLTDKGKEKTRKGFQRIYDTVGNIIDEVGMERLKAFYDTFMDIRKVLEESKKEERNSLDDQDF
ncbi:MAG: MarR family transcriptional regulator [Lachnospiraceae bacterium]|nr:MarR family transcriptional regulator [Lachnospiraceae bacterium]